MSRSLTTMLLLTALGACTADSGDEGIFITKNVAAPDTGCTFAASESSPFLAHGTFSIYSTSAYQLHPQMKSRVTATAAQEDARTILLRGARVELEFADPNLFSATEIADMRAQGVTRFETLFSAPLPPTGGIADGDVDLIPVSVLDRIIAKRPEVLSLTGESFRTELIAKVVVFGDMSGSEVTSQEFQYPVTVCNDCVANVLGTCPLPAGTTTRKGNACNPYQDGTADCCSMGNDVICPATVGTAP